MKSRIFLISSCIAAVLILCGATIYCSFFSPAGTRLSYLLGITTPPTLAPPVIDTPPPTPSPTPWIIPSPTPTPYGQEPTIYAKTFYMVNGDTDKTLGNINGNATLPMASTTKIMTAIVAIENYNPQLVITVQQDAVDRVQVDGGSSAQLVAGDQLTLHDLLYGLLVPSGDDAAVAIADGTAGSVPAYVAIMNTYAQNLGLTHTHFIDVDGLTTTETGDASSTSAADLVKLARYAMGNQTFASIVDTQSYNVPPTLYHHSYPWQTNDTLLKDYSSAIGIKTGFTYNAGYCMAFAAVQNGHYLIGAILGDTSDTQRETDVTNMLNWGFIKLSQ